MRPATSAKLRANAVTIYQLGHRYGLRSFALSAEPGGLVATLDEGRSYFDITGFERDLSNILGATVEVVPRGPGVDVEETEQRGRAGVPAASGRRPGMGSGTRGDVACRDAGYAASEGYREESSGEAAVIAPTVIRFADWTLGPDITPGAPEPIYEAECTTCGDSSGAADAKDGPEIWCIRHAGRTGHTGFRGVITSFFRAALLS